MKRITLRAQSALYEILIAPGLFRETDLWLPAGDEKMAGVISDTTVASLYADLLLEALAKAGWKPILFTVEPGESAKSLAVAGRLYGELVEAGLTRKDLILALGGGVVGDLAGFVAATLYRGISFFQIPTTLLAQVDSSVGGKVAINLPQGKNLVGAFYQPSLVVIDPELLRTLPPDIFRAGMAEVIKYGAICDENLFQSIVEMTPGSSESEELVDVIIRCVELKKNLVEQDPLDGGVRMLLNFGHTIGHVYEQIGNYQTYSHGQAVAAGMAAISRIGVQQGLTDSRASDQLIELIQQWGLPDYIAAEPAALAEGLRHDKKTQGTLLSTVFMRQLGNAEIVPLKISCFLEWITAQEVR